MAKEKESLESSINSLEKQLKDLKGQQQGGSSSGFLLPVAIIIAGLVIAGAVVFTPRSAAPTAQLPPARPPAPTRAPVGQASAVTISPVTEKDHIRGSLDAPVKIVEFSDFECPFCKRLHPTLKQVMSEYGDNNQVAWVYRQFPLDSLHPVKARKEAVASECAAEQGGNDMFWAYTDTLFQNVLSNNRTDMAILPELAKEVGLDVDKFNTCLESGKFDAHVEDDVQQAVLAGGTGTPYSVIIAPNGKTFPLSGAQPYSAFKAVIDLALKEK